MVSLEAAEPQGLTVELAYYVAQVRIDEKIGNAPEALTRLKEELAAAQPRLRQREIDELRRATAYLEANLAWDNGDVASTIAALRDVTVGERAQSDRTGVVYAGWMLQGQVYEQLRQFEQSAFAFDRASIRRPDDATSLLAAGISWANAGRSTEAVQALMRATRSKGFDALPKESQAEAYLVLAHQELQAIADTRPNQRRWQAYDSARAQLRPFEASQSIDKLYRIALLDIDSQRYRGEVPAIEIVDQLKAAESKYDSVEFQRLLVGLYESIRAPQHADRVLAKLLASERPVTPETLGVQAALKTARNETNPTQTIATEFERATGERRAALRKELAQALLAEGRYQDALTHLKEELDVASASVEELRELAEASLKAGEMQEAKEYERVLKVRVPELKPIWQAMEAQRLIVELREAGAPDSERLDKMAGEVIAEIRKQRPDWPPGLALLGNLESVRGNREAAIDAYLEAIRRGERRIAVFEQVVPLLMQTNRHAEIMPLLDQLKARQSMSTSLAAMGLAAAAQTGQLALAEKMAREALQNNATDARAMVWLGDILRLRGEIDEAEKMLRVAVAASPGDAATWFALFRLLRQTNQTEAAVETLEKLRAEADLTEVEKLVAQAEGYASIGMRDKAQTLFESANELKPNDPALHLLRAEFYQSFDPSAAESAYRRTIELQSNNLKARRQLAFLLVNQGLDRWNEARQLLESNGGNDSANDLANNRRIQAMMLFERGGRRDLEMAKETVELLADDGRHSDGDKFLLAGILLRQAGDEPNEDLRSALLAKVEQHLLALTNRSTPEYTHLASHVLFLLQNDRAAEATPLIDRYRVRLNSDNNASLQNVARLVDLGLLHDQAQKREPQLPPTLMKQLRAMDPTGMLPLRFELKRLSIQGDEEKAKEVVEAFEREMPELDTREKLRMYEAIGDLCWEMNASSVAEEWFRKLTKLEPSYYEKLAMVLARQGRSEEAIELCMKMADEKRDFGRDPALMATAIMVAQNPTAARLQEAIGMLQKAQVRNPDSIELMTALAGTHALLGENAKAIRQLRRAQELDAENISVLNDLSIQLSVTGRPQEAIELVETALRLHGNHTNLFDTKALALLQQRRYSEAITLLERAVAGSNGKPIHRLHLAMAYAKAGENAKARQTLPLELAARIAHRALPPRDRAWIDAYLAAAPE